MKAEVETVSILLRRGQSCLEAFLDSHYPSIKEPRNEEPSLFSKFLGAPPKKSIDNRVTTQRDERGPIAQYLSSIKDAQAKIGKAPPGSLLAESKLFPTNLEAPEFAHLWTIRSKAMYVLKLRCSATIDFLALRRFRTTYPPYYACPKCLTTFLLRAEFRDHCMRRLCLPESEQGSFTHQLRERLIKVVERTQAQKTRTALGVRFQFDAGNTSSDENKNITVDCAQHTTVTYYTNEGKYHSRIPFQPIFEPSDPGYLCWQLAEPLVEAALRPLSVYLNDPNPSKNYDVTVKPRSP
jgi:hypothetical protein